MIAYPEGPFNEPTGRRPSDPSPREIARRAKAIRRGWTDAQRKSRLVQEEVLCWLPPFVMVTEVPADPPSP